MIEGFVKFEYFSKAVEPYIRNTYMQGSVDDENIIIKTPNIDMDIHQYFNLFKKFLLSVGFCEQNIISGACHIAFNDGNDTNIMKTVSEQYDLIMGEDLSDIMEDRIKIEKEYIEKESNERAKIWEDRYWATYNKLKEIYPHQNHLDAEIAAMCSEEEKEKDCNVKHNIDYLLSNYLTLDRNSNFPRENTWENCDKNDPSEKCKSSWESFWQESNIENENQ